MEFKILNILFSTLLLGYSVRIIYFTYKEPADQFSTNLKGYFAGITFTFLSISSLIGKFDLLEVTINLFKETFKLKSKFEAYVVLGYALFFLSAIAVYYYLKYNKNTTKRDGFLKTKFLINTVLIYCTIAFLICLFFAKKQ